MSVDDLLMYMEDTSQPLDERMKVLVQAQGLNFQQKAYLGEALLEIITDEERKSVLEGKIIQLGAKVKEWRARALNHN